MFVFVVYYGQFVSLVNFGLVVVWIVFVVVVEKMFVEMIGRLFVEFEFVVIRVELVQKEDVVFFVVVVVEYEGVIDQLQKIQVLVVG